MARSDNPDFLILNHGRHGDVQVLGRCAISIVRNTGQPAPQRVSNHSLCAALHDPQRTLRIVILPNERVLVVGVGRRPVGASVLCGDCSRHDRAVVCMNDLTHLLSLEADAALLGAAPPDELADGEEEPSDSKGADEVDEEVVSASLEAEDVDGWLYTTDFHPLFVGGDRSTGRQAYSVFYCISCSPRRGRGTRLEGLCSGGCKYIDIFKVIGGSALNLEELMDIDRQVARANA